MTPRQIVEYLNKHIVGQSEAKRAIAIAMRNRYAIGQPFEPSGFAFWQLIGATRGELPTGSRHVIALCGTCSAGGDA
jgi:hypothetical protein